MDKLTAYIGKALGEELDGFKFVKSRWHLIKDTAEGWQAIAIEVFPTSSTDVVKLASHGHIRIDAIEDTCGPLNPFLNTKDAKSHQTITINCDRLLADTSLIHGFSVDKPSVEKFASEYALALKNNVLPWLERYSNEQFLFDGLIDDDPLKWITSDRLARYPAVLAILAKRGDWNTFDRIANEFLDYCNKPHAQAYKPVAESLASGLREAKT